MKNNLKKRYGEAGATFSAKAALPVLTETNSFWYKIAKHET
jgi:hypothetical protein